MNRLEELDTFRLRIKELQSQIQGIRFERNKFCEKYKVEIKALLPKKGKVYELIDPCTSINIYYGFNVRPDEAYYVRPTNVTFYTKGQGHTFSTGDNLYIKGDILDSNFKVIHYDNGLDGKDTLIKVNNLKERTTNTEIHTKQYTKVYVLIDKNTGYYKIGRSKNPIKREKTLQSEKPTIELLFYKEGINRDEKVLHEMFSEKRVRGEWFDLSGSDLSKIKDYFN